MVRDSVRHLLAQKLSEPDTHLMRTLRRSCAVAAAMVVTAGVSWFGLKQHRRYQQRRSQIACEERDAALTRRFESIKQIAHEELKIGSKKADVSRFYAEQGMALEISKSEAFGALRTTGCGPSHCGDGVLIGVRVKLDLAGAVTEEPTVETLYDDCP
jgi:hypothetical protein